MVSGMLTIIVIMLLRGIAINVGLMAEVITSTTFQRVDSAIFVILHLSNSLLIYKFRYYMQHISLKYYHLL